MKKSISKITDAIPVWAYAAMFFAAVTAVYLFLESHGLLDQSAWLTR